MIASLETANFSWGNLVEKVAASQEMDWEME
jgi:hypothetical protein